MNHDNVNQFFGACVEQPNICILTSYCPKGSLQVTCCCRIKPNNVHLWLQQSPFYSPQFFAMLYVCWLICLTMPNWDIFPWNSGNRGQNISNIKITFTKIKTWNWKFWLTSWKCTKKGTLVSFLWRRYLKLEGANLEVCKLVKHLAYFLQDILENEDIKLDWMFKVSLVSDLTNVSNFNTLGSYKIQSIS